MRVSSTHMVIAGAAGWVLWSLAFKIRLTNKLAEFIPSVEGFEPHPYWDESRYSWGYGTRAPGSTGTISRDRAFADMLVYLLSDYDLLKSVITRALTVNQWVALLSFSYNLGNDDAVDIAPIINSGDDTALHNEWMRYVHSGGTRNPVLVNRRNKEWGLWVS